MNNIYLTGSNEVAIVDFVKNHEELYDKTNEHFKDKVSKERLTGLQTVTNCLSRCARPGLSRKGHIMASTHNPSLVGH